eukprot:CAMPEP_0206602446 /NCGR_PEP_ID=MMETSP0325_2-20121206/47412_1 /ASSEMBLY_ACC=CAM_ASM_000347 /TAXON_ID=2866 /ORGANISM="Crypthecodinium cohnii, Strain Seligo" /LENGTH=61 /DNA_ID=CAMNT_0054114975 /DNA_START=44 /DNA_END=225 /DNA_ORIENTATION=+
MSRHYDRAQGNAQQSGHMQEFLRANRIRNARGGGRLGGENQQSILLIASHMLTKVSSTAEG